MLQYINTMNRLRQLASLKLHLSYQQYWQRTAVALPPKERCYQPRSNYHFSAGCKQQASQSDLKIDLTGQHSALLSRDFNLPQEQGIARLVEAYRIHGHKRANINPLSSPSVDNVPELSPENYGLSSDSAVELQDGTVVFVCDVIQQLGHIFCGSVSIETSQLNTESEKNFMSIALAELRHKELPDELKKFIAKLLVESEAVDHFLASKFTTLKRYGGEGAETAAVFCQNIFEKAAGNGIKEIIIGMPHRGRTNLMFGQLKFPPEIFFRKCLGLSEFPHEAHSVATGDVISHLTSSVDLESSEGKVHITMLPCPSHLEAVNPVAMGKTRGRLQTLNGGEYGKNHKNVLCFLMHGDAAIAGQGIVAECFNMANLPHFNVGGTLHLIVNNQLGFTTPSTRGRSSQYSSDIGKLIGCPVIHVSGDHPEDVYKAANIALQYREMFQKDIIIDLLCFRRWGHNEMDDPSFTQPIMYRGIESRPSIPEKYAEILLISCTQTSEDIISFIENDGLITTDEIKSWKENLQTKLNQHHKNAESFQPQPNYLKQGSSWGSMSIPSGEGITKWDTGYPVDNLCYIGLKSVEIPQEMRMHSRLIKMHADVRKEKLISSGPVDWSTAEALAFGSLLQQGFNVRLCGQDVGRGTFSHRHDMITCQDTENEHIPLNHISEDQRGKLEVVNSFLSEEAVLGFEYGMSIEDPNRLVIWEAQFGDFFTGAQIIIDTFINSGEAKWMVQSGLVMLLPHGYDGMGPEHSSCRIERFLQSTNSKEDAVDGDNVNISFCNPTTPAQYFHLLRRQMMRNYRKPLIVASPKIILRLPAAASNMSEMGPGTSFKSVLKDPSITDDKKIQKVILCSGKHYYALSQERKRLDQNSTTALVRIEELCPFPTVDIKTEISKYSNAKNIIWAQEEPRNMGAWSFVAPRFENQLGVKLMYAGRPVLPTPAVGIGKLYQQEVKQILDDAFR